MALQCGRDALSGRMFLIVATNRPSYALFAAFESPKCDEIAERKWSAKDRRGKRRFSPAAISGDFAVRSTLRLSSFAADRWMHSLPCRNEWA